MRVLTLTEHARFVRADAEDLTASPPAVREDTFEALRRHDEALAAHRSTQIFDWRADSAKASQWVGVIQCGDLCVEVLPKVGAHAAQQRHNLLVMLEVAGHVPRRPRALAGQRLEHADLMEVFIARFVEELLELLSRGVQRDYVSREENMSVLRGKLVFSEHIKHNSARQERFYVRHDELLPDHLLDQILRATCARLHGMVRSISLRKQLVRCLAYLEGARPLALRTDHFDRLVLTRQTAHWGPAIGFCRMVHEGLAPSLRAGARQDIALLFDMNALFEAYVSRLFVRMLQRSGAPGYRCVVRGSGLGAHLLREHTDSGAVHRHLRMKPDIMLVHTDRPPIVIDTKWKRLWREGRRQKVSREDLYQMFGYAHTFGSTRNILLYPRPHEEEPTPWRQDFELPGGVRGKPARIEVHTLDLNRDLCHTAAILDDIEMLVHPSFCLHTSMSPPHDVGFS